MPFVMSQGALGPLVSDNGLNSLMLFENGIILTNLEAAGLERDDLATGPIASSLKAMEKIPPSMKEQMWQHFPDSLLHKRHFVFCDKL
jgi:hypothetical protein